MTKVTLNPTITFNGKEATDGIIDPIFRKPSFQGIHTIHNDIKAKEQIAFLRRFNKVTIKDPGCGSGYQAKEIPMYEKFWDPVDTKIWLKLCWKDFLSSFFAWGLKNGIAREDLSDTQLADYLMDVVPDAALDDLWRIIWFGDTAISDITDSPAGTLGSADDVKYYNIIDGLWKQIFSGTTALAGTFLHIPRYTISYNALGSKGAQLALPEGYSKTVWRQLYYNADERLKDAEDAVILCTRSLFDNWREYKESKLLESSFKKEDGMMQDGEYWDYPIIPIKTWDRIIRADFDNGTAYNLPHRAILTTLDQIHAGFDAYSETAYLKTYLDEETELFNIKGGYKVDAKIMENFMFSVAY